MSEYTKVKISDFLTERQGRYKPDDKRIAAYKRLEKIDFSGTIHISEKPTKTDMILVYPGDLVISGINVAKGAVAVYQGKEPVCATIHYSSYVFDEKKVDLEYFKYFVKSPSFVSVLQQQVKGGIKTEIKPKHLLPLEITIPNLETQRQIVKRVSENFKRVEKLNEEIESQETCTKQLRQNILQDSIEGKLTADWRNQNPVVKGNPDFDAQALFEKIQKEKKTDRKQKNLVPITEGEMPFEIPESWKWVRLGEICNSITDGDHQAPPKCKTGIPFLVISDVSSGKIDFKGNRFVSEIYFKNLPKERVPEKNSILYTVTGSYGIPIIVSDFRFCVQRHISIIKLTMSEEMKKFVFYILQSLHCKKQADSVAWGVAVKTVPINALRNFSIPLPPLAEQKEIVAKVESLLSKVAELEKQIQERKKLSGLLMQTVLKNTFAPQE